jgi:hypothetical protein
MFFARAEDRIMFAKDMKIDFNVWQARRQKPES